MTENVKRGDKVKVHYTGRFEDGKVFDSSREREPIQFEVGSGTVIKGLEEAVVEMKPGEKKKVKVEPEEAYGQYNDNLLVDMPKDKFPDNISPEKGMNLQLINKEGKAVPVVVKDIGDDSVQLDANHPLAGKVLVFDLELMAIV
ncbi:MAG: peptidylprolyl isomerase [Candidatus Aminicenantes bacterium]